MLLAGCATNATSPASGGADNQYPLVDSEAAFGEKQTDWNTPFWRRWTDDETREKPRATDTTDQRAAPAATTTPAAEPTDASLQAPDGSALRPKIGVIIDGEQRDSLAGYRFVNALKRHADANGISIIEPDALRDAARSSELCTADMPSKCGQALAIYPGVRALLVVRPDKASSGSDRLSVQTRMIDADFGFEYEPVDTDFDHDGEVDPSDIAAWSNRMLGLIKDRIAIAPWFTHSFARDGQDMYVSAGHDSGLTAGSVLTVRDDGSLVRAPGGRVVAWKPGRSVGKIRIKQLIGSQIAVAEHLSGRMPQPDDKLMAR